MPLKECSLFQYCINTFFRKLYLQEEPQTIKAAKLIVIRMQFSFLSLELKLVVSLLKVAQAENIPYASLS